MTTTKKTFCYDAAIPISGSVAIFAQGPVGMMATVGARLLNAGPVIAVESVPERQELAKHFGADVVLDFGEVADVGRAFDMMKSKEEGVIKPLIRFG